MKDNDLLDLTREKLRWLRPPGMAEQLGPLLAKAAKDNLTVLEVVDRLCDEEKASRLRNAIGRRIRDARFPELNTSTPSTSTSARSARSCAPATSRSTTSPSSTRASIRS